MFERSIDKEDKSDRVKIEPEVKISKSNLRSEDLRFDLAIGFDDAILGCDREILVI